MKIQVKLTAILLLLSAIAFTTCGGDSDSSGRGNTNSDGLLPLAVGNTWTHTWIVGVADPYPSTTSVLAVQNISGEDTYKTGNSTLYNFYRNHDDGLYNYGNNLEILTSPRLYLKYPCSVGDSWDYDDGTFEVTSISASVGSDAGTFECIEYYYTKDNDDGTYCEHLEYWSPGVGQILQDIYLDHVKILSVELKSYSLN